MLGWAVTFLIIALIAAVLGYRWNCRGISRNCQVLILFVPGDVRNFLSLRLERKTSTITHRSPDSAVGSSSQYESIHHLDVRRYAPSFSYNSS
jgi:uncharacterized membrane protein YtjA (UPF0391 family)